MKLEKKTKVSQLKLTISLLVMIAFFIGTIVYIYKESVKKDTAPKKPVVEANDSIQTGEEPIKGNPEEGQLCVVKSVDSIKRVIVLFDIEKDSTVQLSYTGATDIKDEYSQVIAASQLNPGDIVQAVYKESDQTLLALQNSPDAWEYTNVSNLIMDRTNKIIKLYGQKYRYSDKVDVRNSDGETTLMSISKEDQLTIRGYEKNIYSITITKGHGTVVLINSEYFEGGKITIGGQEYVDLTSDMVFTVREGDVQVEVEKDTHKESTTISVLRDEEVVLDLGPLAPEPQEKGEVTFIIYPFGAELFVDDALMSYSDPLELTYGDHSIEVSLNGYETYQGVYTLNAPTDVVQIELPQTVEEETPNNDSNSQNASGNQTTPTPDNNNTTQNNNSSTQNNNNSTENNNNSDQTSTNDSNQGSSSTSQGSSNQTINENYETDEDHVIEIKSPIGASVYINGVYKGIVPLKVEKPLGVTYITLLREGYKQITYNVKIKDDGEDKTYTFANLELEESTDEKN